MTTPRSLAKVTDTDPSVNLLAVDAEFAPNYLCLLQLSLNFHPNGMSAPSSPPALCPERILMHNFIITLPHYTLPETLNCLIVATDSKICSFAENKL